MSPLPPWDKSPECLNAWVDKLRPGFKAEGFFGGGMSFVQRKHWEYKKAHGLLPERVEIAEPLTARETEIFHAALVLARQLDKESSPETLAKRIVERLSFKVSDDDIKKVCGDLPGS
jgi:ABC-type multidrug transport system ATPase subunit